jgi:pimeloyl-ACP methyl ester carboxylesterase
MIARITRILILLQAAIATGLFILVIKIWQVHPVWLAILLALFAVLLLRMALTLNSFILAWRYRSEMPSAFRLTRRQACRLFLNEFKATMWSSSWTMPFQAFKICRVDNPVGLPVLLLHGYGCNSGYWKKMSIALSQARIIHSAIDLEPVFGTIDDYATVVHHAVEQLIKETGKEKIIVLAHSMGGLVARSYIREYGDVHVAKIITLGTPHYGTWLANYSVGVNCRQMRWARSDDGGLSSEWLNQLAASENTATRSLFVSIYSHHDNIISPQTSSYLPGAKNIEFHGIGHVALAFDKTIIARVTDEILLASQAHAAV